MTELDHFALLNDLKSILDSMDKDQLEIARIELNDVIDRVQADCDERHRIYLERVERYMGHVDSALKDKK
jgi:hypothetical protein